MTNVMVAASPANGITASSPGASPPFWPALVVRLRRQDESAGRMEPTVSDQPG